MAAIIGDQSIDLADGTILRATTDLDLARKWAKYKVGQNAWDQMQAVERYALIADALSALRQAYQQG